jgi:hypothetical protein
LPESGQEGDVGFRANPDHGLLGDHGTMHLADCGSGLPSCAGAGYQKPVTDVMLSYGAVRVLIGQGTKPAIVDWPLCLAGEQHQREKGSLVCTRINLALGNALGPGQSDSPAKADVPSEVAAPPRELYRILQPAHLLGLPLTT